VTAALFSACAETFELHLSTSFGALAIVGNSYHNSISGSLYVHSLSVPLEAERLDREKEQVQNEARSRKMWLSSLHGSRMKNLELILLLVLPSISFGQDQPTMQDPAQLVGKEVNVQRMPLCQPGTYTADLAHAGKRATVVSVKPNTMMPALSPTVMSRLPPETRAMIEDQQRAATLLLLFEDGTKLDTCAPVGPKKLAEYLELAPGQTLMPVSQVTPTQPVSAAAVTPQECPVVVTKVTSSEGGFGHGLVDDLTTSEYERQTDKVIHEGQKKHYLDMRMLNKSTKPIRAVESVVVYSDVMGAETKHEALVSQNNKPIKPGQEYNSSIMDRSLQSANGLGDVTVYVEKLRYSDNTFWQDNGSHSCKLTSQIKR
jgi:hypothetical protein